MNFGTDRTDRASRRILAAMIVAGAALTCLSFAMQLGPGAVKSRLQSLVDHASSLVSIGGTPSR